MMDTTLFIGNLWASSLAVIPIAIGVSVLCQRWVRRPATRHALWLMVLLTLLAPSVASLVGMPSLPDPIALAAKWARSLDEPKQAPVETFALIETKPSEASPKVAQAQTRPGNGPIERAKRTPSAQLWSLPPQDAPVATQRDNPFRAFRANQVAPSYRSSWQSRGVPTARYDQPVPLSRLLANRQGSARSPMRTRGTMPSGRTASTWSRQRAQTPVENEVSPTLAAEEPVAIMPRAESQEVTANSASNSTPSWVASGVMALREWGSKVRAVRDAVVALPPMPAEAWFGGVALILIVWLSRGASRRKLMASAVRAPESVQLLVDDTSRVMGLDQSPAVYFIDGRISPMVLAMSFRPRLILPRSLWNELEHDARRSVLVHELAHLLRRDHWVCWTQWVIGLIYWWHPVVWWIRRRIREEADLACDAWVMSLLPSCRRTYAETLVRTKDYLSDGAIPAPALALEMTSPRAKRFARRLTMVMTQNTGPKASPFGLALAAAIALSGMLMTPALGCHTQKKNTTEVRARETIVVTAPKAKIASAPKASKDCCKSSSDDCCKVIKKDGVTVVIVPKASKAPKYVVVPSVKAPKVVIVPNVVRIAPVVPIAPQVLGFSDPDRDDDEGASTFERHMNQRGADQREEAIEKLEQQLEGLEAKIRERVERQTREAPRQRRAPRADPPRADAPSGDTFPLIYVIPEGKLGALARLMIREDIPVLVRPGDDGLTVWGTRGQHRIFRAFAELINPDGVKVLTPDGESVRATAPRAQVGRRQHEHQMRSQQRQHQQQMQRHQRQQEQHRRQMERHRGQFERHRDQMRRNRSRDNDGCSTRRGEAINRLRIEIETRHQGAKINRGVAREIERQVEQFRKMAEQVASQAEAMTRDIEVTTGSEQFASAIEGIEAQRDAIMAEADALREQAEELVSQADDDDLEEVEREAIEAMAEQLEEQAEQIAQQAELFEEQVELVEEQAEEMAEAMTEAIEAQVEAIEEQAEAYEDAIEELMEEIEELVEEAAEMEDEAAELEAEIDENEDVEVVATTSATSA